MKGLLSIDSPVLNAINAIVGSVWLNILWFLCCIPLFTIGASTTALFSVTLKMARNEEGNITAQFFAAFRDNFKFSTKVWGILAAGIGLFSVDGYLLYHLRYDNAFWTIVTAIFLVALAAFAIVLMYIFPLMAYFENTIGAMFKNSLLIGIRYLYCTVFMAGIYFIMVLIIVRFFTPAVIFGEGVCAYLCSHLLKNVFLAIQGGDSEEEEEGGPQEEPDSDLSLEQGEEKP